MLKEKEKVVNDIIVGISKRSAYKFKSFDQEDLVQELWMTVLEKEKAKGDLDLDLIAKICYDKVVDLQRYLARRNHIGFEEIEDFESEESSENAFTKSKSFDNPSDLDRILINDLIRLFPEGSKERLFLSYWCTATGFKDFGISGDGRNNDGYTESDLAHKLGYSGTSSGGFKKFRNRMRTIVEIYISEG